MDGFYRIYSIAENSDVLSYPRSLRKITQRKKRQSTLNRSPVVTIGCEKKRIGTVRKIGIFRES